MHNAMVNARYVADEEAVKYEIKQTDGDVDTEMMYPKISAATTVVTERLSLTGADSEILDAPNFDGDKMPTVVRPWMGTIVEPEQPPPNDHLRPNVNLYLEHVYGYNSTRSRNNLFYNSNLEVIYPVATAGIIYSKNTNTQKFFQGHEAEIISLATDPTGKYVVSGQAGKNPMVKLWSATTGIEICSLPRIHTDGISGSFHPQRFAYM